MRRVTPPFKEALGGCFGVALAVEPERCDPEGSEAHSVGVPESAGIPACRQCDTRSAPVKDAVASALRMASLSRLSARRHAASPIPFASNKHSRCCPCRLRADSTPAQSGGPRSSFHFQEDPRYHKPAVHCPRLRISMLRRFIFWFSVDSGTRSASAVAVWLQSQASSFSRMIRRS